MMPSAILDIFLSLLPARYRRRWQSNPLAGAFRSGILEALAALVVYAFLFFRYIGLAQASSGGIIVNDTQHNLYHLAFGLGALNWVAFTISPGPLLALYFAVEGAFRVVGAAATQEVIPTLPAWLAGQVHSALERAWRKSKVPPPEPDVVEIGLPGSPWDLRVSSVHAKPEWRSLVQIEYNGDLYRLESTGEETTAGKHVFRYYLRRSLPSDGFHGVVHYDPFAFYKSDQ